MHSNDDLNPNGGADLSALSLDELIRRTEAAYVTYHSVPSTHTPRTSEAEREALRLFFEIERALNARVRVLVEDAAPEIFDALERGGIVELIAAAERFRALPACARRWMFALHLDAFTRATLYDANEDFEPSAYLDAAIERRRLLVEGDGQP